MAAYKVRYEKKHKSSQQHCIHVVVVVVGLYAFRLSAVNQQSLISRHGSFSLVRREAKYKVEIVGMDALLSRTSIPRLPRRLNSNSKLYFDTLYAALNLKKYHNAV